MDSVRLAATAYFALLKQVSEIQQRIVLRQLLIQRFGRTAIPINSMFHTRATLAVARDMNERQNEADLESLEIKLRTIEEMETVFAAMKEESDKEFFKFMKDNLGRG